MSCRIMCALLLGCAFAVGASGSPPSAANKVNRHDPAFRAGYMDGYRRGANQSEALALAYDDQSGPTYEQAIDGYAPQYGDQAAYQKLFRLGYIEGYKAGWDFNSGQYNSLGGGGGGASGG
ncbi:MAG: hypothetical protein WA188_09745 [Terriglobales bacterium]